jgi:hypothetical protein
MSKNPYALNRRQALALIGTAALANDVNTNLARIGSRVYSEEGVAMFLACENLSTVGTSPDQTPAPSALNQKVASAFQRYTREWQHSHPDAPASDVAKILEVIADKDFSGGGREPSL